MTLEAWVQADDTRDMRSRQWPSKRRAPGDLFLRDVRVVGLRRFSVCARGHRPGSPGPAALGATTALPTGAWSHLAATYDRTSFKLFINGTQVASKAFTGCNHGLYGRVEDRWQLRSGASTSTARSTRSESTTGRRGPSEIAADRDSPISGGSPLPPSSQTTAPHRMFPSPRRAQARPFFGGA